MTMRPLLAAGGSPDRETQATTHVKLGCYYVKLSCFCRERYLGTPTRQVGVTPTVLLGDHFPVPETGVMRKANAYGSVTVSLRRRAS